MSNVIWYEAATLDDFSEKTCKPVWIEDKAMLIVYWHEKLYAFLNNCPHENLPLTGATIEDDEIVCPHHGARFCLLNGAVMAPPAFEDLEIFPIKLEYKTIYIGIQDEF